MGLCQFQKIVSLSIDLLNFLSYCSIILLLGLKVLVSSAELPNDEDPIAIGFRRFAPRRGRRNRRCYKFFGWLRTKVRFIIALQNKMHPSPGSHDFRQGRQGKKTLPKNREGTTKNTSYVVASSERILRYAQDDRA